MRLLVAVELTDRCSTEPLPAALDNRPVDPLAADEHPLAAFAAQLLEPYLRLPQNRTQKLCAYDQVSDNYAAASSLSSSEKPRVDRSV